MASDTLTVKGRDGTVYGLHTDSGGNWVPDDELDVYDAVNALCDALLAARAPAPVKERDDVEWLAVDAMDGSTQRVADKALPVDDDRERLEVGGYVYEKRGGCWYWTNPETDKHLGIVYFDASKPEIALIEAVFTARAEVARLTEYSHRVLQEDIDAHNECARLRGERERLLEVARLASKALHYEAPAWERVGVIGMLDSVIEQVAAAETQAPKEDET